MRKTVLCVAVLVVALAVAGGASATKPGSGSSTGVGSVFIPNPVQSLGIESLTDQKDSDAAVPVAAYHDVTLTNLDGSGFLRGDYASIISETGNAAYSPTNTFRYTRHQDEFEQVMAYYWITEAEKYIQSARVRLAVPGGQQPAAERADQPVGRRQLVRDRPPEERASLRQGRRRRRRGRGSDPARVRARDSLLPELLVRLGGGRRDQRGLRRLLVGRRLEHRHRTASGCPTPTRRASPTGTRRRTRALCRTACAGSTRPALPDRL